MKRFVRAVVGLIAVIISAGAVQAGPLVTPLVSGTQLRGIVGITTDGTNLYLTNPGASPQAMVLSVPLGGGGVTSLYNHSGLGITNVGSNLFWVDPNSGPFTDPQILKAPKDGSGPITPIYTGSTQPFPHPFLDTSGITTDGSKLYWSDEVGGLVFRINQDGTGITQLGGSRYPIGFADEHFNAITEDNGILYIADAGKSGVDAPQVVSIPTSGGTFTTLFSGAPFVSPFGIAEGNGTLYVADRGAKAIWSLPISGGMPTLLVSDARFETLDNLIFYNNSLYVADAGNGTSGTVWKVDLTPATATPEPSTLALMGTGGLMFLGYLRRRRKNLSLGLGSRLVSIT